MRLVNVQLFIELDDKVDVGSAQGKAPETSIEWSRFWNWLAYTFQSRCHLLRSDCDANWELFVETQDVTEQATSREKWKAWLAANGGTPAFTWTRLSQTPDLHLVKEEDLL